MKFFIAAVLFATQTFASDFQIQTAHIPLQKIKKKNKTLVLSVGFGSGAFHHPKDPKDVVYFITDRGPNISDKDAKKLIGTNLKGKKGKVFPVPTFTPTIYKVRVGATSYEILEKIEIKSAQSHNTTGLTNPKTETGFDVDAEVIPDDPEGLDTEAIVKLKDGTFYVSEEYLPSLVHLDATGKTLQRLVPGEHLPWIVANRPLNRGIEAITISPDEKFLYFMMQSPLRTSTLEALQKSRIIRMFRLNLKKRRVDKEFVYYADAAETFLADPIGLQQEVKVSEMTMIDQNRIVVLERIENTTKLYVIDLRTGTNIYKRKWDTLVAKPTLEELDESMLANHKIKPVQKKLLLDTAATPDPYPAKLEGLAYLGSNRWIIVNDNDFGITGEKTKLIQVTLDQP